MTSDSDESKGQGVDPFAMASSIKTRGPAPVHLWDPPFCGDIDLCIRRDGSWVHEGRPIRRPAMVKLFASILKKEGDEHFLVTPVEKVRLQVEDCPFLIVDMDVEEPDGAPVRLELLTNTEERFALGPDHGLTVSTDPRTGEPHPTVEVRSGLRALVGRNVFYRLVELAEETETAAGTELGVSSQGVFFSLGQSDGPD